MKQLIKKIFDFFTYYKKKFEYVNTLMIERNNILNAVMRERDMYADREKNLRDRIYSLDTNVKAKNIEIANLYAQIEELNLRINNYIAHSCGGNSDRLNN